MGSVEEDHRTIVSLAEWSGDKPARIAAKIGVANTTINRHFAGTATTRLSMPTWEKLRAAYPGFPKWADDEPDLGGPDYVSIDVMPSYAGMGGGGSGEGDREVAKLSRRLIEEELRGKPQDFALIDVRGESMAPDFLHGDQILVDKRDCDPRQPGSFALWDGDAYVLKLVEKVPQSDPPTYRIFSANGRYSQYTALAEEVQIMGRPVWFARRL